MINEMIEIFIGALNYAITEICGQQIADFALYDYFVGLICLVVPIVIICGSFALLIVVVAETFQTIRGSFK